MFHTRNIADELADIRSEINALKSREKMLREVVLSDPDSHGGQHHEVVVKRQKRRVLLRDRLPAHILENPAYWEVHDVSQVTLRARHASGDVVDLTARRVFTASPVDDLPEAPDRAIRSGDPVAACPAAPLFRLVSPDQDDSDVLEAFAG